MKEEIENKLNIANTISSWAENQLRILQEMIDDRLNDKEFGAKYPIKMEWLSGEIARIRKGLGEINGH